MKKLIQKAVKVLAFLLVLALCYGLMDQVLKIKTACRVVAYRDKC